jgi:hypothetical protein
MVWQYRGRSIPLEKYHDFACVELAVRYIELRYIGSYSGFIRARLARALKNADISEGQRSRLNRHFSALFHRGEWSQEWRQYFRLWRRIIREQELEALIKALNNKPDGERRSMHLRERLAWQDQGT